MALRFGVTTGRGWAAGATRLLVVGLVASASGGCHKPLFSPRETRTQYDRYDRSRDQYEPQFLEDEFGRRIPNLRGRLTPKA